MTGDWVPVWRSPDGTVEVRFTAQEMRMSVWVHEPLVYRTRDGALVLDLDGTLLDPMPSGEFPAPNRVRMRLRKYPRGDKVRYDVTIDVEAETFGLDGAEPDRPLSEIAKAIQELTPKPVPSGAEMMWQRLCPQCGAALRETGDLRSMLGWKRVRCVSCGATYSR